MFISTRPSALLPMPRSGYAFISLLADGDQADRLAAFLTEAAHTGALRSCALVPPVRGIGFFADTALQPVIDRWWAGAVPRQALPVYILDADPGLGEWIGSVDGHFMVSGVEIAEPGLAERVTAVRGRSLRELVLTVLETFGRPGGEEAPFDLDEGRRLAAAAFAAPRPAPSRFRRARLRGSEELFRPTRAAEPHPIPNVPAPAAAAPSEELITILADTLQKLEKLKPVG